MAICPYIYICDIPSIYHYNTFSRTFSTGWQGQEVTNVLFRDISSDHCVGDLGSRFMWRSWEENRRNPGGIPSGND